ncbi:MAG TPA: PHP domain-containing protein [Vicinamibacterales bacterium]|nr:PHP domain-containing protein [Vicinamibacterales bacterium]
MIDLHTHTTASDGRCTPADLVVRAAAAGVTVLSITDHDTVGAAAEASAACRAAGLEFVAGIEITAVYREVDVHVLGYFLDVQHAGLRTFLQEQRMRRVERLREIVGRLERFGIHLDADALVQPAIDDPSKSAGRPWIARALVNAGHVASTGMAFDKWLSRGQPAFVPRLAATPEEVAARIHDADGVASLAHPGLLRRDEWIPVFTAAGLDALEAYHSEHDASATARYLELARRHALRVSGGSDFHGDPSHGPPQPGAVSLPRAAYDRLRQPRAASAGGPFETTRSAP